MLSVEGSINAHDGRGGTARARVEEQLNEVRDAIEAVSEWFESTDGAASQGPADAQLDWYSEPPGAQDH